MSLVAVSSWITAPAAADTPATLAPPEELKDAIDGALRIRVPEAMRANTWAELTTLGTRLDQRVLMLAQGQREGWIHGVRRGKAMLCSGGEKLATRCEQIDLEPGSVVELPEVEGVDLVGRFVQGRSSIAARVAVAPADLAFPTVFTMPLTAEGGKLRREVQTGDSARFRISRLAPGDYLLEAELATGRIYRSERITVPSPDELRRGRAPHEPLEAPTYDLGEIVVEAGLAVEFFVSELGGQPLQGATVGYSQQTEPMSFKTFKTESDGEGRARVSGIDPELPGQAICQQPGYRSLRQTFDLPPAYVECILEPLARLTGRVLDTEDVAVTTATVTLESSDPADGRGRLSESTDGDGAFTFHDLPAGEHRLVVAAAGFAAERLRVNLEPGEELELDAIALLPGRELWGVVVDADSGEPIASAAVRIDQPPGGGDATTDEQGEFRLTTDFEESLWLQVASERHALRRVEIKLSHLGAEKPFEIRLSPGGRILAEVFDEATGLPCEGCRINFGSQSDMSTDAFGRALSEPLDPGTHAVQRVRVQSRGSLIVREGGFDVKRVSVHPGETVTVRFGEPKMILEVFFDRPLPAGWELATRSSDLRTYHQDADGVFRIRWRPGELTELSLSEAVPGFARKVWLGMIPPDHESPRLELTLWDTLVTGLLLAGETPAVDRSVELRSLADSQIRAWARSDASGYFTLPFVAPGSYALFVEGHMGRLVTVTQSRPLTELEIHVPPG